VLQARGGGGVVKVPRKTHLNGRSSISSLGSNVSVPVPNEIVGNTSAQLTSPLTIKGIEPSSAFQVSGQASPKYEEKDYKQKTQTTIAADANHFLRVGEDEYVNILQMPYLFNQL